MKITVILCTYNRARNLTRALNSVAASDLPGDVDWEVLVVDNNSSDQTREVVENFCRQNPDRFRYMFEPKPGKSNALNSGLRESRGDIFAFMDDDVIVDPKWLQNLTEPLRNGTWAGTGGRIFPEWTSSPPRWVTTLKGQYPLAPLAAFDLGPEGRQLFEPPFGTNMAFRREVFEQYGGFRTDLGPTPTAMAANEDAEFGSRLLAANERLRYEPSAIVHHEVAPNRLHKKYFLNWWRDKGSADIRQTGIPSDKNYRLFGVPLYLFRRLAVWTLRWQITIDPPERFDCKIQVWGLWGQISECYRLSLQQNRPMSLQQNK